MHAFGQLSTSILDQNNVSAMINNGGTFFNDELNGTHGYEVPKGSGAHAFYSAAFWFGGVDQDSMLHLSGSRFVSGADIFPGPIATAGMYTSVDYTSAYGTAIWSVLKSEIDNHILNWNQAGYITPSSIADWPGNGDQLLGVSQQLAPYVDVNNNGIYEPTQGDYPNVRGDEATYVILNDEAHPHSDSGGDALGIEVHLMLYQFLTTDYLNDITFINSRVFNRGDKSYSSFKTTFWGDSDLGNPTDDYFGSDASRNLVYAYNGDLNDETSSTGVGYGANPPAIGVVSLSNVMSGACYFTNGSAATQSDPSSASQYWNYMNNKWRFGDQWVYGGTGFPGSTGATSIPADFMFPSDSDPLNTGTGGVDPGFEWDESANNNPAGDRRMLMNLPSDPLLPGDELCYDFAVVFATGGPNLFDGVNNLATNVDQVQTFFDAQDFSCETVTVGTDELSFLEASIYPNPSQGEITISFKESMNDFSVNITDISGKSVFSEKYSNTSEVLVNLNGAQGIYLVQIQTNNGSSTERIVLK
jgi:hypothetical protein